MKNNKKLVISMATCAFVASLGFGIAATTASADTEVTPLTVSQITATPTMKSGAEMRIDNTYNGLRFTMYVEDSTYASLQASGNVTYGMLIAPEDYVATYGALDV